MYAFPHINSLYYYWYYKIFLSWLRHSRLTLSPLGSVQIPLSTEPNSPWPSSGPSSRDSLVISVCPNCLGFPEHEKCIWHCSCSFHRCSEMHVNECMLNFHKSVLLNFPFTTLWLTLLLVYFQRITVTYFVNLSRVSRRLFKIKLKSAGTLPNTY